MSSDFTSARLRQAPKRERDSLIAKWAERDRRYSLGRTTIGPRDLGEWVTALVRKWRVTEAMEIGDLDLRDIAQRWPYR